MTRKAVVLNITHFNERAGLEVGDIVKVINRMSGVEAPNHMGSYGRIGAAYAIITPVHPERRET